MPEYGASAGLVAQGDHLPLKYVRALDGVRGIAILFVVLFHYTFFSCGWAGVQLFFVLSGFLITSILVSDSHLPLGQYLKKFYWRRTLRIFPLYFGYLAILGLCYGLTGKPELFGRSWMYLLTYTINFQRLDPAFHNNIYFGHFWSLAVEEQFYFIWPLLIYLLRPKGRRVLVVALVMFCPIVRALTAYWVMRFSTDPNYVGQAVYSFTPAQLDAFATGAALVVFGRKLTVHPGRWLLLVTVVLLAAGQSITLLVEGRFALNTSLGYPINMMQGRHVWGYSLINFWAACLILLALEKGRVVARWLSYPAIVFLGRVSYGMYLFHLVVQAAVYSIVGPRHSLANLAAFSLYFASLTGLCFLSYRFYESRFLKLKDRLFQTHPVQDLTARPFPRAGLSGL